MAKALLLLLIFSFTGILYAQEYEPRPEKMDAGNFEMHYYQKPGSISLHLSNFMFGDVKSVSMPITLNPQITVLKNFTMGPSFTYFKSKYVYQAAHNVQVWENSDETYRSLMPAIRGEYHITPLLDKIINKPIQAMYVDVYLQSWVGYQFVTGEAGTAEKPNYKDEYQDWRGGIGIGVRTMLLPFMGIFLEVGYSRIGYGSFGLSFKLK
ncbi:MAG: hypothetical protein WD048_00425 [Chitinophagales bacterium]